MRTLGINAALASLLVCGVAAAAGVGSARMVDGDSPAAVPTNAAEIRAAAASPRPARPVRSVETDEAPVVAGTLTGTDGRGPQYGGAQPAARATLADGAVPIPLTTDDYGDPDAVIVRAPVRDYGSGFHMDYGRFKRETSSVEQIRAAVASPKGCMIVGDSIATFVVKDLVARLQQDAGMTCVYDTWPGRATEGTANAVLDLKRRYGLPRKMLVISGTNDIFNPPLFEAQMNRLVEGIGPEREIFWVSTFDSRRPKTAQSEGDERNTAWINSVLEARAARTQHMSIIPWDALFRSNAANVDKLLSDGVHPNEQGIQAMVGLVRRSIA